MEENASNAAVLKLQTLSGTSRSSNSKVAKSATARKRKPAKKKEPERSLPLTGGVITDSKQEQQVDHMMHEFDQYVFYHEIKKKTEKVLSSQEEKFASQEGPQTNAPAVVSAQPDVNVHTELKKTEIEKDNPNVERREEVQLVVGSSSGVCSSVTNGNEDGVLVGDLTYLSENVNAVGEVLSSVKDLVTCEKDVASTTPDDASSSDDSDENVTDGDCKHEDYMFPSPEEMEKASVPQVGRVFTTLDEAKRFVNVYALMTGFGIKKGRNHKNRKIAFCCNKSRKTVSTYTGARKRRRNVLNRTNCGMHVTVILEDGKWHIQSQDLRHNHPLVSSPSLTQFFLSHRSMNEAEMLLSKLLQEHRVKPREIMSIFRKLCGGKFGNITFDVKKLDNLKQVEREKRRNIDIEHTMNYIEKLQVDKPGFIFKVQRDSANSILSLFWTDSRSRLDYLLFGDIISFDTTFSTNKYNMPFAPIIGVNGHSRTIFFGWALCRMRK